MATNTVTLKEAKKLINYAIDTNLKLEEEGKMPIAISLESSAGIGKTSLAREIAKDRGMNITIIRMAQLEEPGDLVGFPLKEYECQVARKVKAEDGTVKTQVMPKTVWMNEKQLDSPVSGMMYRQTGKTRMSYAKPAWVPEYCESGNLVVLDDYVRGNPQLLQSCMDLILEQGYVSWTLPKKTSIILTNNPDDGSNNVNSLDEAQRTRFMNFEAEFSIDSWAQWAEKNNIDGRCINFVMTYYKELFSADGEGNRICNPRSFVMFANMISGIKDWDNADSLAFISTIAKGCFKDEGNRFASMFTTFIRNKMHLMVQPKEMLLDGWDTARAKIEKCVYDDPSDPNSYRAEIASLLERRFVNYVNAWLDSDGKTPIKTVVDRILNFIDTTEKGGLQLFNQDLFFHMIKSITAEHRSQTNKLLFEPKIAKILS